MITNKLQPLIDNQSNETSTPSLTQIAASRIGEGAGGNVIRLSWNKKEMLYNISWLASNSINGLETRCWGKAYRLKPILTRFPALYRLKCYWNYRFQPVCS